MSNYSSAKYYQNDKKRLQIKFVKDIKVFVKKKKEKSDNMDLTDTKIYHKMKNKSLLSTEKNIPYYSYEKIVFEETID